MIYAAPFDDITLIGELTLSLSFNAVVIGCNRRSRSFKIRLQGIYNLILDLHCSVLGNLEQKAGLCCCLRIKIIWFSEKVRLFVMSINCSLIRTQWTFSQFVSLPSRLWMSTYLSPLCCLIVWCLTPFSSISVISRQPVHLLFPDFFYFFLKKYSAHYSFWAFGCFPT